MKPLEPSKLKIRSSALGNIIALDRATQLTGNQVVRLQELITKESLTEKQAQELQFLTEKRDAPDQLSKGAKTYIQDVFFGHVSGFQKQFTSKFTQKGNLSESRSIAQLCKFLGLPIVVKNEAHFENDYTTGTPDTIFKPLNFQIDMKNVYYPNGLDTFDPLDTLYEWQLHSYNWLTGVENGFVCKILLNPPDEILEKEIFTMAKIAGVFPITDEFREEVRDYFDYESRMPIDDRVKLYHVKTEKKHIDHMIKCVKLAREYYGELCEAWMLKNKPEIEEIKNLIK